MAVPIDGGSGSTEEEEVVGGAVFEGLEFSSDSTVEAFEGSSARAIVNADELEGDDLAAYAAKQEEIAQYEADLVAAARRLRLLLKHHV